MQIKNILVLLLLLINNNYNKNNNIIIFLGLPGIGKTTQAKLLAYNLNIPYISAGEILRTESITNPQIKHDMVSGKFVGNDVIMDIIFTRLQQLDCSRGYILDGFPRNFVLLEKLEKFIKDRSVVLVKLQLAESIRVSRIKKRNRLDDNNKALYLRVDNYHKYTDPVEKYLIKHHKVIYINGHLPVNIIKNSIITKL